MEKLRKIKPMFNRIITTMNIYEDDVYEGGILVKPKGTLKEYQTVVAIGTTVTHIKEGDEVCINPVRYGVLKHQDGSLKDGVISDNPIIHYNFNTVILNDEMHLLLYDTDIEFVILEKEDVKESVIKVPDKQLILN